MMQDVYKKSNPRLPEQSNIQHAEALFTSKLDLKLKEETSKVLHLEHSFV
jgi:hypothetical protein